ncbi:hypothetical protein BGX38DRAFT_1320087 [Terfezia claveryi]|nr:hypothetical protein BGX38DRAFT_1320087 [Terfezia claveryi]
MDSLILRCNIIRCRTHLQQRAVVTTCSHIFCPTCAESHGLIINNQSSNASGPSTSHIHILGQRSCPACRSALMAPDDAVLTVLNPSEEYKTSLLSGLAPGVIMEVAGRGLAFWGYQAMQEVLFQETFARNLGDKYATLNTQLDKLVHDANTEISGLRKKLEQVTLEREGLERKCVELGEMVREKGRKALQFQDLYDKLKRKMLLANVQSAANETAENIAMGGVMLGAHDQMQSHGGNMGGTGQNRFVGRAMENPISIDMNGNISNVRMSQGAGGGGGQGTGGGINSIFARGGNGGIGSSRGGGGGGGGGRSGNNGMFMDLDLTPSPTPRPQPGGGSGGVRGLAGGGINNNNLMSTPHRQRLIPTPVNTHSVNNQQQYGRDENFFSYQNPNGGALGIDRRQPLGGLNENNLGMGPRFGGHVGGLSAGIRIGRPQGSGGGGNGVGMMGGGGVLE